MAVSKIELENEILGENFKTKMILNTEKENT